jgi:hypothetical protein
MRIKGSKLCLTGIKGGHEYRHKHFDLVNNVSPYVQAPGLPMEHKGKWEKKTAEGSNLLKMNDWMRLQFIRTFRDKELSRTELTLLASLYDVPMERWSDAKIDLYILIRNAIEDKMATELLEIKKRIINQGGKHGNSKKGRFV